MAIKATITNIPLVTTPGVNQVFTIIYRLTSDPDVPGSYTTATTSQTVTPAGVCSPPLVVGGLLYGTSYTFRAINNCNTSYTVDQVVVTPLPICVAPQSMTITTAEE